MPKVIQIDTKRASGHPQPIDLPVLPVQDRIIDLFFDGASIPEIACKTRNSATVVLATIRAYSIIHHRQSCIGLLEASPWVKAEYRRVAAEVLSEIQERIA